MWYYVDLAEEEGALCSALPSPLPETRGIEYYIEVVDEEFRPAITPTTEARVVSDGSCGMPVYETAGVVSVFSLATGLLEVPAGFAATSVATAGGASGAGAAGGAAGGSGGGGLSTIAVVGGLAAAAAAGVVVARDPDVDYCGPASFDPAANPASGRALVGFRVHRGVIDLFNFEIPIICAQPGKGTAISFGSPPTSSSRSGDTFVVENTLPDRVIIQGRFSSSSAASGSYQYFVNAEGGFPACDGSGTWTAVKMPHQSSCGF